MDRQENLENKRPEANMERITCDITDMNLNSDLPICVSSIVEMLSTP